MKKISPKNLNCKNIEDIKNYFAKVIDQNELISKKHKKVSTILNYTENFLISITGCVSISAFSYLVAIPVGITSSVGRLKICKVKLN